MSFPIEECQSLEAAEPALRGVELALREIYPAESVPESGEAARRFLRSSLGKPGCLLLMARQENSPDPAGFLFLAPRHDEFLGTRVPCLYLLHVRPELRRLGIARDLLAKSESWLLARGEKRLIAPATHNDDAIISMGERRGYLREREWMVKEF